MLSYPMITFCAIAAGFALDLCIGDPEKMYVKPFAHPVVLMGKLISRLEKIFRRRAKEDNKKLRRYGVLLSVILPLVSLLASAAILYGSYLIHPILCLCLHSFFCYQILAARCLIKESSNVRRAVESGNLPDAQNAVGRIVGRDVRRLDMDGVIRAAVETVAENASDGVIAPLIYMLIGGAPLGFCYKAINTMDSMVGYTNEKYLHFGRAAAKLDDAVNYIPSRISGFLFCVSAFLLGEDGKNAFMIWKRDRRKHASPNSAQTESACAGALRLRLAGDAWYFGKLHRKPFIGDDLRPIIPEDITRANWLMLLSSVICLFIGLLLRLGLSILIL